MEFRLLGPVELWSDGRRYAIGRAKERCLLAILLQEPGRKVSVERLVGWLWDDDPPPKARDNLYVYISRLKTLLAGLDGTASIVKFRTGGYALHADRGSIDLHRFRSLRAQARAIAESGDDEQALALHRQACALFRGEPLEGLLGNWAAGVRLGVQEDFFHVTLERIEVEMRLGHHADLVSELYELIKEYPDSQALVSHLMLTLYRLGRGSAALEVYFQASHRWWAESRTRPSRALEDLQQRILKGDRALLPVPRIQPTLVVPRTTLPDDIRTFTGRENEVAELLELASARSGQAARPRAIAVDGLGGVGKTVLCVHLAHRLARDYPDGQLYLDLHGYDAEQPATEPGAALDALLQMLGVPAQRIPRSIEDRTALWRSELASRRVLVVLDNAAGHEQIRPLLFAAPGCLALVTSRRRLVGLDDVWSHSLDVLSPTDAARLLELAIGPDRTPDARDLAEVVRLCDHLPLAIQLVGNRLRHRRTWTVADLAERLSDNGRRLAEIRAEDREITAVFDLSYRGLTASARRAFRRLGLHLGPDFTLHSAAAAIGVSLAETDRVLEDLLDHHLVIESTEGRFRFHNLIREYARQLAESQEPETDRRQTIECQLDHYVAMALLADRLRYPFGRRVDSAAYPPPEPAPIETAEQAEAWLAAEYQNLMAAAEYAAEYVSPEHVALLAHALARSLEDSGRWDQAATLHERAVGAWRELGDILGEAQALLDLSVVCFRTGRYTDALADASRSLALYEAAGDACGKADVLDHRGLIFWHQSHYREALASSRRALALRRSIGDQRGAALALDHIAIYLEFIGQYDEAAATRASALEIFTELDDTRGLQMSLNNQGDLMLRLGRVSAARGYYERAAAVDSDMARQHNAIWLSNMARIQLHTGHYDEAIKGLRRDLQTYRELGDRRNEIEILVEIGAAYFRLEKYEEALAHYQWALALSRDIAEVFEQAKALRHIGEVLLRENLFADADEILREALELASAIGEPYERAQTTEALGHVYLRTRGRYQARRAWRGALRFYERAGMTAEAATVRSLLDGAGAENA